MGETVEIIAQKARKASAAMRTLSSEKKNDALIRIADELEACREEIQAANVSDLKRAEREGLAWPLLKRLEFGPSKLSDAIRGIRNIALLADPVGLTTYHCEMDKGLDLYRVTCPFGVAGVIFESRPDALVQISCLCLKSSNAVILKGGSEADETNAVLSEAISRASVTAGIPDGWISLIKTRSDVGEMLKQNKYIDLIIPRGSNEFVAMIMANTSIPVLGHADGVCHIYIDKEADRDQAVQIVTDAKTQYPAVCNAAETVLVHKDLAQEVIRSLNEALSEKNVTIYGCDRNMEIIDCSAVSNWHTEYLDLKISVKVTDSLDEAADHINTYGSGHTDAIITRDPEAAEKFMSVVDSGNVFWNCSTRFSDGFRYGFGAEVGVSTSKMHARGPVGLEGLVTYKYKLFGNGQTVSRYASGKAGFIHKTDDAGCPFDR